MKDASQPPLLPHQAAFVETVLSSDAHCVVLQGNVGLGKSRTLAALASRFLEGHPAARALFIAPRMLLSKFVERLKGQGTPALLLDRYQFRLMLDSNFKTDFWPRNTVIVTNFEFAMQEDIEASLAEAEWNILIVDEAHSLRDARVTFLQKIDKTTNRVVLASASNFAIPEICSTHSTKIVEWSSERADYKKFANFDMSFSRAASRHWAREEFLELRQKRNKLSTIHDELNEAPPQPQQNRNKPSTISKQKERIETPPFPSLQGRITFSPSPPPPQKSNKPSAISTQKEWIETPPFPSLRRITFSPSQAELALQATISDLEKKLIVLGPIWKRRASLLRRSSRSSPAALETVLQTLLNPPERGGMTLRSESGKPKQTPLQLPPSAIEIAMSALQQIDAIDRDSKLIVLGELLARLGALQRQKVGVLTDYSSTMYYIAADIEASGLPYYLLQAETETSARARYLEEFSMRGGTLVATAAAITEGFDSPELTDLVLYDPPDSGLAKRELLSRLTRPGSQHELNAYIFTPNPGQ